MQKTMTVVVVVVHFSLVTTLFCFISLDTLLATFLWLYWVFICVFSCVSLHLISVRLSASCHIPTCFFVDVVHFSLMTTLFLFHYTHYWPHFCVCIECLCVCLLASLWSLVRLAASCHVMTFVVVHFSLITTLFCFISLDTLLATFLCLYWLFMCVFSCISLHLISVRLSASCHVMTFVVVHFSLMTTLFCFISLGTLLATSLWLCWVFMCVFTCVSLGFLWFFLHHVTLQLVSLLMFVISHSWQLSFVLFH